MSNLRHQLALLLALTFGLTGAFEIVKNEPQTSYLKEGETLTLLCTADTYWEWCTFKHADKICDYVWTKPAWNVSVLACDDFADREVAFHGAYDYYQCGITIKNARPEDAGLWSCEMESYHAGYTRKYGYVREVEMMVEVEVKTTTMTTTRSTSAQARLC